MRQYLIGAALVAVFLWPSSVQAHLLECGTTGAILKWHSEKRHETAVAGGLTSAGRWVQVFTSEGGATWAIVITDSKGISCLIVAGEGWRNMEHEKGEGT